jgi:hypothetical protein
MEIPKNSCRRIESGARGLPAKSVRVYPTQTGAATMRPKSVLEKMLADRKK